MGDTWWAFGAAEDADLEAHYEDCNGDPTGDSSITGSILEWDEYDDEELE